MFAHSLSPRYLEVDQLGVVFNMWYLGYLDEAMAAFLGELGRPYPDLVAGGHDVMLARTELDWSAPLRYGDRARIEVRVESIGRTSFVLRFDVVAEARFDVVAEAGSDADGSAGRTACRARTVYVFVARDGSGKLPLPDDLRAGLERHA